MQSVKLSQKFLNSELTIRTATAGDAKILSAWWNDGKIMEHAGFPLGVGTTEDKVKGKNIATISSNKQLLIVEVDNKPVGEMNYKIDNNIANFGIKICDVKYQGAGLGTKLLTMLFNHLFFTLNCNKITCDTNLKNIRAQHVYKDKMHMTQTKTLVNCWTNQVGELQSTVFFELTKEDYLKEQNKV